MKTSKSLFAGASAVALALALSAGQTLAADVTVETGWRQVAYSCESGQALTVAYRDSGKAARVIVLDQPPVKLLSRPSKSGFRFGADRYELRGEGDAVTWQIGSKTPLKCTSDDPAASNLAADAR